MAALCRDAANRIVIVEVQRNCGAATHAGLQTYGRVALGGFGDGGPCRRLSHPAALPGFHRRPPRGFRTWIAAIAVRKGRINVQVIMADQGELYWENTFPIVIPFGQSFANIFFGKAVLPSRQRLSQAGFCSAWIKAAFKS